MKYLFAKGSTAFRAFLFLFLFSISCFVNAQNENDFWYFGNGAGLTFNSSKPQAVHDGELYSDEGCATVSDSRGRLLFYTNGVKVWDRTHKRMKNGYGLSGGASSTQSAVIVPKPGSNLLYYIFTVAEKGIKQGLSYSIVDMMKNASNKQVITKNNKINLTPDIIANGGLGDVTEKNKVILAYSTEKLTSVEHANGKDIWVITHQWNTNAFYAFLVTSSGIERPVVSKIGTAHRDVGSGNSGETIGQLKVSPNGKLIAVAVCYIPNNPVELFNFDNATGKITDPRNIPTSGYAYGLEFSPNSSKIYVSFLKGAAGVKQFDLTADDFFEGSYIVASADETFYGALQVGPDNRIYVARTGSFLDVIDQPDLTGLACKYKKKDLKLGARFSVYGLPGRVTVGVSKPIEEKSTAKIPMINLGKDTTLCSNSLTLNAMNPGATYKWSTGQTSQVIEVTKTGIYSVKVSYGANSASDEISLTFDQTPLTIPLGADTSICADSLVLNAGNTGAKYIWSTGETTQSIVVRESKEYTVTVTNEGCSASNNRKIEFFGRTTKFSYLKEFEPAHTFINNYFAYSINDIEDFEIKIFGKGNKVVFESTDPSIKWRGKTVKGKDAPKGVYKWQLQYMAVCSGKQESRQGTVKLNR